MKIFDVNGKKYTLNETPYLLWVFCANLEQKIAATTFDPKKTDTGADFGKLDEAMNELYVNFYNQVLKKYTKETVADDDIVEYVDKAHRYVLEDRAEKSRNLLRPSQT